MEVSALALAIEADIAAGKTPAAVVASTGTTAFDPLAEIIEIANAHDIWVHVDAAMAGSAIGIPLDVERSRSCGFGQLESTQVDGHYS